MLDDGGCYCCGAAWQGGHPDVGTRVHYGGGARAAVSFMLFVDYH